MATTLSTMQSNIPPNCAIAGSPSILSDPMRRASVSNASIQDVVMFEGWVLKKRRKKMQGFARRYFTLYQSGLLSYSFEPGQPSRDEIALPQAAISTAPGRKDIHIDSNNATFHMKCLSTDDFNKWMKAFRTFKFLNGRKASLRSAPIIAILNRTGAIVGEMDASLTELEEAIGDLQHALAQKKSRSPSKSKSEKEKNKDHNKEGHSVFGLFKRSGHSPSSQHESAAEDVNSEPSSSSGNLPLTADHRVQRALAAIKSQHESLVKSLNGISQVESSHSSLHNSPLPSTAEEEEEVATPRTSPPNTVGRRPMTRASIATSIGDSLHEWFDAQDNFGEGAEEFTLDAQTPQDEKEELAVISNDSRSSLDHHFDNVDGTARNDTAGAASKDTLVEPFNAALQVTRRDSLPARPVGDEGSLFAVLKKNVGKDLSTVALPVTFNEPLTLLQRAAEEVEYHDLLNQAAATDDQIERMCFIAAFAVSGYAHTRFRTGRKGFNPMLGETFEDVRLKFIAEKVCHHPVVMAYHTEGDRWSLDATSEGRTKFWGKSLEIIPLGTTRLKIGDDYYVWRKPSSFMRNLVMGTKYLEHCGTMTIENVTHGGRCALEFKQGGYWATPNEVSGTIQSASGEVLSHLEGKWDEQVAQTLDSSHLRILWRPNAFPRNAREYYGFTTFGITLNEITSDLIGKLPPTDSRLRPDVRALEEGDLDAAEAEKVKVEETQRERRRRGQDREPKWFKKVGGDWEYAGGYWEQRARGWKDTNVEPLW